MPKINIESISAKIGSDYPAPFDKPCATRQRKALGDAGGLSDFGVNLMTLPPGVWSSQRHWHSHEDEYVYVVEGEVKLIEDNSETILRAGDCAAFPKNSNNGHHIINESSTMAVLLEVGSRHRVDITTYSDIDMKTGIGFGGYLHKGGAPY